MRHRSDGGTLLQDLDQMFRDNYQWVYRTAYGVTRQPEDAEDVLQNLFLRLLQRGFPQDVRKNAKGYLYRAAMNLALNSIRSRRRQMLRENVANTQAAASSINSRSNDAIEASLLKVIGKLDPENAELLLLRYVDDHCDAEIARMRGPSRGAIAVRLFRTRTRIRKLMRAPNETLLVVRALRKVVPEAANSAMRSACEASRPWCLSESVETRIRTEKGSRRSSSGNPIVSTSSVSRVSGPPRGEQYGDPTGQHPVGAS